MELNEKATESNSTKIKNLAVGGTIACAIAAPLGALSGVANYFIGKSFLSFFDPVMAGTVGSIGTFASVGAIAAPLAVFPYLLIEALAAKSSYLNRNPNFKNILMNTSQLLLGLGAVTCSALMLGIPPFGATVISMMVLPVAIFALKTLFNVGKMIYDAFKNKEEVPELNSAPAYGY